MEEDQGRGQEEAGEPRQDGAFEVQEPQLPGEPHYVTGLSVPAAVSVVPAV